MSCDQCHTECGTGYFLCDVCQSVFLSIECFTQHRMQMNSEAKLKEQEKKLNTK